MPQTLCNLVLDVRTASPKDARARRLAASMPEGYPETSGHQGLCGSGLQDSMC